MRVYCDMCADLFHYGHVRFLKQCQALGDVVVGIHSDQAIMTYKPPPIMTMTERIEVVASCRYVHEIVPNSPLKLTTSFLSENNIDLVVVPDNCTEALYHVWYEGIDASMIHRINYTSTISSTDIRKRVVAAYGGG